VINTAGSGSGTVTASPNDNGVPLCGANCYPYPFGTVITLTAVASPGSTFAGWSGGGCTGTGTCTVTLNQDTFVTATFN
jgi:hypothetical protein